MTYFHDLFIAWAFLVAFVSSVRCILISIGISKTQDEEKIYLGYGRAVFQAVAIGIGWSVIPPLVASLVISDYQAFDIHRRFFLGFFMLIGFGLQIGESYFIWRVNQEYKSTSRVMVIIISAALNIPGALIWPILFGDVLRKST